MKKIVLFGLALLFSVILVLPISTTGVVLKISTHPDNINNEDVNPEIVVDFCGNSYVTWYGWDGIDYEIYWARIDSSGSVLGPEKISTDPYNESHDDYDPKIAVDRCGNSYVTWKSGLGVTSNIYWVKIDASGTPGIPKLISNHEDNEDFAEQRPHIGVDIQGNSYVAYRGYDGNDYEIYWVKIDATEIVGNARKISIHLENLDNDEDHPRIAVDVLGYSYVSWKGYDGNDWDVYWAKVDSTGNVLGPNKISTHPDNVNRHDSKSEIAIDALGNSYVVWRCWSTNTNIYWVKVDSSGVPGTVQRISNVNHTDDDPQIAADYYGNSYVTWEGHDGNNWEIFWAKIDSSGSVLGPYKISTHPDNINNNDANPEITVNYHGNSYVAWHGYDGNDYEIYWTKMDSSGGVLGPYKISTHLNNIDRDDLNPHIATNGCGLSYVVWKGYDGNDWEIYWVVPPEPAPCC